MFISNNYYDPRAISIIIHTYIHTLPKLVIIDEVAPLDFNDEGGGGGEVESS